MITNITEITATDVTLMELSEEIRYMKRDVKIMREDLFSMSWRLDEFFNQKKAEAWKRKKRLKASKRV
jgi:hypothetical protein